MHGYPTLKKSSLSESIKIMQEGQHVKLQNLELINRDASMPRACVNILLVHV